ncbi:hypothetical protein [Nonomuraea sp. SYSU D8015]|uniref:hypothetical protein n=1 Tax=Nonomuraea sp. SYSU D8015 TaxID=2593644 RepID=UPI0016609510|nr:hypothetical protein [Nonomuraea sp. SYSU D8015]
MNPRFTFIAAPLLMLAYGLIRILDGLDGVYGPGLAWTAGHLAFMGGLVFFVVIFRDLYRRLGRAWPATISVILGLAGIACLFAQFGIDIVIGFMAADRDAMGTMFDQVQALPAVRLAVYDVGPFLFYVAQFALVVHLAVRGQVKAWMPVMMLAGLVLPVIDKDLIPVSAIVLVGVFWSMSRGTSPAAPRALART